MDTVVEQPENSEAVAGQQTTVDPAMIAEMAAEGRASLYFFAKGILGYDWLNERIHRPLCELLQDPQNVRQLIVLPRAWLKSTLCTIAFPIWLAIKNPNIRVLLAQNTATNASKKLAEIRQHFEKNEVFKVVYSEVLPDKDCRWTYDSLTIRRAKSFAEGTFEAVGVRNQVTSRHYDVVIEDDTVAPDFDEIREHNIVPTKDDIGQAIGWHKLVIPLLNSVNESRILVVGTRWFEKDLISWIKSNEPDYSLYERAVRELDGKADPAGQPSYPERFDEQALDRIARAMGPYLFSCLYMNLPLRSEDQPFQKEWVEYYVTEPLGLVVYTTVDPAGDPTKSKQKKADTDYNVVMTVGKDLTTGRLYVLEYSRRRCNPGELIDTVFQHVRQWHPVVVGIEGNAYQGSLEYWVRERMQQEKLYFTVELFHSRANKGARIMALQPLVLNKALMFRFSMVDLIAELEAFPLGAHDDLIDALASQLQLWAMTKIKNIKPYNDENDPNTLDAAITELRQRALSRRMSNVVCSDILQDEQLAHAYQNN